MNRLHSMNAPLALIASICFSSLCGLSPLAAAEEHQRPEILSVDATARFDEGVGQVTGVVYRDGHVLPNQDVSLQARAIVGGRGNVARATTDGHGRFALNVVRSGSYLLRVIDKSIVVRVWNEQQAPPAAVRELMINTDGTVIRGQSFGGIGSGQSFGGIGGGQILGGQSFAGQPGGYGGASSTASGNLPGFQNCDSAECSPPPLSKYQCCGGCGGLGGGICKCRSKLLVGILGGLIIGYAIDQDDGPIDAAADDDDDDDDDADADDAADAGDDADDAAMGIRDEQAAS